LPQDLANIKFMSLHNLPKLETLPTWQKCGVQHLEVHHCPAVSSISLRGMSSLTLLDLKNCSKLTSLPGLTKLAALRRVELDYCQELGLQEDLSRMTSLERLSLQYSCSSLTALSGLQHLKRMVYFDITTLVSVQRLGGIEQLASIEKLLINNCAALKAVPDVSSCTKLRQVILSRCKEIKHLPGLQDLTGLRELVLDGLPGLQQEQLSLEQMSELELLSIRDFGGLSRMPDLSTFTRLQKFTCNGLAGSKLFPADGLIRRLHTFCTERDMVCVVFVWEVGGWPGCDNWQHEQTHATRC
jgi:Leucine-rich repeat (LRR) protein